MGGTAIGWFISWKMHENPITMDDLKLPPIQETSVSDNMKFLE